MEVTISRRRLLLGAAVCAFALPARGAITVPSDGTDGVFSPAANIQVDLSQAVTGAWDASNAAAAGKGRYDAAKWAVVYKYASVNIPAGVTVTFKNHPSRAPVVWLVQGNVTISGTIKLDGADGGTGTVPESGPGGWRGGLGGSPSVPWSSGFGPGGGAYRSTSPSASGSYATYGTAQGNGPYGNPSVLPLLGGSGGGGADQLHSGGAGGGSILIATRTTLTLNGSITARGGVSVQGGGAGGGIRLIADVLTGSGSLDASGGAANTWNGSPGRIRLEMNSSTFTGGSNPASNNGMPIGATPDIWPPALAPSVIITQVAGVNAPADPRAGFGTPAPDISMANPGTVTVRIQATNVPTDGSWRVYVRLTPLSGADSIAFASKTAGTDASSTWEAPVNIPSGITSLQARAYKQ